MALSTFRVSYRTAVLVGAGSAIVYAAIWLWIMPAFTPFPSDEISILQEVSSKRGLFIDNQNLVYYLLERAVGQERNGILDIVGVYNFFKAIDDYRSPVYLLVLHLGEGLCQAAPFAADTCRTENVILGVIVFSNALIVFLLGAAAFRITGSLPAQISTQALYAFSAWPATYYFLNSYTVLTSAIALAVLLTLIEASYRIRPKPEVARIFLVAGGLLCSLALYSSPAASLIVGLLLVALLAMAWEGGTIAEALDYTKYRFRYIVPFIVAFAIGVVLLSLLGFSKLRTHLLENVSGAHHYDAIMQRGYVPQSPSLTYFRILHVYGGIWLSASVALAMIALPFLLKSISGQWSERATVVRKTMFVLLLIVGVHALMIDLLPFTKLARTHFVIYPPTVLVVAVVGHALYARYARAHRHAGVVAISAIGIVAAGMVSAGWQRIAETVHVRSALVERIAALRTKHRMYVLLEDPHRKALLTTLNWRAADGDKIRAIGFEEFYRLAKSGHDAQGPILVVGPHGPRSGISGARHSALPDFDVSGFLGFADLRRLIKATERVEYYMYHPPFLLEEEVSQAYYFAGMTPDPKADPSKRVMLLVF